MSASTATANNILKLIFNATAWANVADNAASSPLTQISCALHTADPGDSGTQSTSESAYTSYARQTPARSTGGWTASSAGSTSPVSNINFPSSGAAGTTVTHFSTGKTGGGATEILASGTVTPNITIAASGVVPRLDTATVITVD